MLQFSLPVRTSSPNFNLPGGNLMCPPMSNTLITMIQKFQLVRLGKSSENQLARSQNLLVTDEQTSVKIFTDIVQGKSEYILIYSSLKK